MDGKQSFSAFQALGCGDWEHVVQAAKDLSIAFGELQQKCEELQETVKRLEERINDQRTERMD